MPRHVQHTRPVAAALFAIAAMLSACTATDPRLEDEPAVSPPSPTATTAPLATGTGIGSAHVILAVGTADAVTIDVTDHSGTLIAATSGTPGDGASVEVDRIVVTNISPTMLRLTWIGGPCPSANSLSIDALRGQFLLMQPGCSGDALATDRVLELEFATPIDAAGLETSLQDGLDT